MSADPVAMGASLAFARARLAYVVGERGSVFGDHMSASAFEIRGALQAELRDAYLAGYAEATRDAKDAVAATIRAEVPERRQGSRSIE